MSQWLAAIGQLETPAILITVAAAEGSVPRGPGTKMLVTAKAQFDTIGGGHLELSATEFARAMLEEKTSSRQLRRFPLGPGLGQCCGGVVHLLFERIDTAQQPVYGTLRHHWQEGCDSTRRIAIDSDLPVTLEDSVMDTQCHLSKDADGSTWLIDPIRPPRAHLFLFGAGHVGAALVRACAELPCRITWVDEREALVPASLPLNVTLELTDTPEAVVASAPPGSAFLVTTHSHALDQTLAEHILRRDDVAWFGLIGSRTKRMQFEHRLHERGISKERLATMVCPIGIPGIEGKEPAVIAIAVAAQLLQVWQGQLNATVGWVKPTRDLR